MAEFGIKATGMSAPDTKAAKFVRPPTEDQSSNILLKSALQTGLDAYQGYQMADLEKEQEKVINDYMASKQNPAIAEQATVDIGGLDKQEESLWKRVAGDATYQPDVNDFSGIQKGLDTATSKLKLALEQGVMSPDEFATRTLKVTREAVNRNPGLAPELMKQAQRVLDMSGITDVIKKDIEAGKSAAKQQEQLLSNILSNAAKHNVPTYMTSQGTIDYARIKADVDKVQFQQQAVTAAENFGKIDSAEKIAQASQFMEKGGIPLMNGNLDQVMNMGISLIHQGGDYQGAITQVRLALAAKKQQLMAQVGPIANQPAVKAALDYYDKQSELIESNLSKAATKEDFLKQSTNLMQLTKNDNYMEVAKLVNPELLQMTTQILNTVGAPRILEKNPELMGQMITTFGDLLGGVAGSPRINYDASVQGKNVVSQGIAALAKEAITNPKAVGYLEKSIHTIATDVQNPDRFKDTTQKFSFYEKLIRDLGNPDVKKGLSKIGAPSIAEATGMIDDYMKITEAGLFTSIRKWEKQGTPITLDILPDGRIHFISKNPQATADLNSRYTSRVNDSLSATANLMGLDTKSAAQTFFQNYLNAWADDPDLQPKDMKPVIDQALRKGQITKEQYDKIMAP